jgi:hypothetical protein
MINSCFNDIDQNYSYHKDFLASFTRLKSMYKNSMILHLRIIEVEYIGIMPFFERIRWFFDVTNVAKL